MIFHKSLESVRCFITWDLKICFSAPYGSVPTGTIY